MLADYHMHTSFSNDSKYPMKDAIKKAIELGIDEICFTEHSDYGTMGDYVVDYNAYYQEYRNLKEKYKDKISIKFGCEFGVQEHTVEDYDKDFKSYDFDFIILSNHQIEDIEFWTYKYQEGKTQDQYNRGYYQAILDVIEKFDNYSVLGHLDMIKRYDKQGEYPDEEVRDLLVKILKHVIKHRKGIEVNTSNFRYSLPDLTPSRYILNLYKELGGDIITIGSDTHEEAHVGYNIELVKEELKKIGFKEFCTYEKMKPIFHKV
ncbi:MAG: histidinol-phosphatase HisJ family protein [Clostridiaceae bacterium]